VRDALRKRLAERTPIGAAAVGSSNCARCWLDPAASAARVIQGGAPRLEVLRQRRQHGALVPIDDVLYFEAADK